MYVQKEKEKKKSIWIYFNWSIIIGISIAFILFCAVHVELWNSVSICLLLTIF